MNKMKMMKNKKLKYIFFILISIYLKYLNINFIFYLKNILIFKLIINVS